MEGAAAFDLQYWEILNGKRMQARTSWAALMDDYRTSDRWTGLKPRTRSDYEKVMAYLVEKVGTRDVKALTRADVVAAQKANAHRTRFANYMQQMMVVLCEQAIDLGWIKPNPEKGVRAKDPGRSAARTSALAGLGGGEIPGRGRGLAAPDLRDWGQRSAPE